MHEEKLNEYWTLLQRYHRATTALTKSTAVDELKQLYNTTSSEAIRLRLTRFFNHLASAEKAS